MFYETVLKSFSLTAPLLVFAAGLFILKRWHIGSFASISRHAGQNKAASVTLAGTLLIAGSMYFAFLWQWMRVQYHLPFFELILALALLGLVLISIFPTRHETSMSTRIHFAAGMLIMTLMYIVPWLFLFGGEVHSVVTLGIIWVFLLFSSVSGVLLTVWSKRFRQKGLYFEIAYAVLFWLLVVSVTYLG